MAQTIAAYASLSAANDWCLSRGFDNWQKEQTSRRQAALVRASDWLDQLFDYKGEKLVPAQPRAWPRQNVRLSGQTLPSGTPKPITEASIELALAMLSSEREAEVLVGLSGAVSQERIGNLSIAYDTKRSYGTGRLLSHLRPYLRSSNQMQVERS